MGLIEEVMEEKNIERKKKIRLVNSVASCFNVYLPEIKENFKFVEFNSEKVKLSIEYMMANFSILLKEKEGGKFSLYHGTDSCYTKSQDLEELDVEMSEIEIKTRVEKSLKRLLKKLL